MNIALVGTGRAAGALGIALSRSGHRIVGVHGRSPSAVARTQALFAIEDGSPELWVLAVSDDAIEPVAAEIAAHIDGVPAVHVSGAVPVSALAPIAATGSQVGSFHPLQTLPDPVVGADKLPGSWIAVTAHQPLHGDLERLAVSIGCHPFALGDADKPLYHAAAAASANFVLAALAVGRGLFDAAGVPFDAARPLLDAIVGNAFTFGPREALTGPIARGDVATVASQLDAVRAKTPELYDRFVALCQVTAATAGTSDLFEDVLR